MNKIAIIMSIYKNDKLSNIDKALKSLYKQTKTGDIFIQIDGLVSLEVKKYIEQEYKNKKIYYLGQREKNLGGAYSYNELLKIILKKDYLYIIKMDADDIAEPYRIERQYTFMENHLDIDVVGGYIEEFGDGFEYNKIVKYPLVHKKMFEFFSKRVPLAHVTACFRKSFFEKADLYPTNTLTNEDTILWLNGFKNGCKFANLPLILVKVRVSPNFFKRRGGLKKSLSDFKDRLKVIKELKYPFSSYFFAIALLIINLSPGSIKQILYKGLR